MVFGDKKSNDLWIVCKQKTKTIHLQLFRLSNTKTKIDVSIAEIKKGKNLSESLDFYRNIIFLSMNTLLSKWWWEKAWLALDD